MKWISVNDGLPTDEDDDKIYLFCSFWDGNPHKEYAAKWSRVKNFRYDELIGRYGYKYSHYCQLPEAPNL